MNIEDTRTSRPRFLKFVLATLGAAVGAAVLPPKARAAWECCGSSACPTCTYPQVPYYCDCPEGGFCICRTEVGCYPASC